MIRYSLRCDRDHEFEGWFGSSLDYDRQKEKGLVECPVCHSSDVAKALMAPAIATSRKREERSEPAAAGNVPAPALAASGLGPRQREMLRQMRDLREKILASAEDVGERFPEEARKIHYGEKEARGIYGKASLAEAVELVEEGVEFLPMPDLPDDTN